eukprot:TRINITY_DN8896_c0_g2_i2.p1 TRINITY_DN8896_c0_g2~~TRINITY_DN8896_c0_g2_i2.p1  ORF type:complete len:2520 (+),score=440.24 TRINITY_DN8896_c0_g2_i2:164-7723(+)
MLTPSPCGARQRTSFVGGTGRGDLGSPGVAAALSGSGGGSGIGLLAMRGNGCFGSAQSAKASDAAFCDLSPRAVAAATAQRRPRVMNSTLGTATFGSGSYSDQPAAATLPVSWSRLPHDVPLSPRAVAEATARAATRVTAPAPSPPLSASPSPMTSSTSPSPSPPRALALRLEAATTGELGERLTARRQHFGNLENSWLVKNAFAAWRGHAGSAAAASAVALRSAYEEEQERAQLDVLVELQRALAQKDALAQGLEAELVSLDRQLPQRSRAAAARSADRAVACCLRGGEARALLRWVFARLEMAVLEVKLEARLNELEQRYLSAEERCAESDLLVEELRERLAVAAASLRGADTQLQENEADLRLCDERAEASALLLREREAGTLHLEERMRASAADAAALRASEEAAYREVDALRTRVGQLKGHLATSEDAAQKAELGHEGRSREFEERLRSSAAELRRSEEASLELRETLRQSQERLLYSEHFLQQREESLELQIATCEGRLEGAKRSGDGLASELNEYSDRLVHVEEALLQSKSELRCRSTQLQRSRDMAAVAARRLLSDAAAASAGLLFRSWRGVALRARLGRVQGRRRAEAAFASLVRGIVGVVFIAWHSAARASRHDAAVGKLREALETTRSQRTRAVQQNFERREVDDQNALLVWALTTWRTEASRFSNVKKAAAQLLSSCTPLLLGAALRAWHRIAAAGGHDRAIRTTRESAGAIFASNCDRFTLMSTVRSWHGLVASERFARKLCRQREAAAQLLSSCTPLLLGAALRAWHRIAVAGGHDRAIRMTRESAGAIFATNCDRFTLMSTVRSWHSFAASERLARKLYRQREATVARREKVIAARLLATIAPFVGAWARVSQKAVSVRRIAVQALAGRSLRSLRCVVLGEWRASVHRCKFLESRSRIQDSASGAMRIMRLKALLMRLLWAWREAALGTIWSDELKRSLAASKRELKDRGANISYDLAHTSQTRMEAAAAFAAWLRFFAASVGHRSERTALELQLTSARLLKLAAFAHWRRLCVIRYFADMNERACTSAKREHERWHNIYEAVGERSRWRVQRHSMLVSFRSWRKYARARCAQHQALSVLFRCDTHGQLSFAFSEWRRLQVVERAHRNREIYHSGLLQAHSLRWHWIASQLGWRFSKVLQRKIAFIEWKKTVEALSHRRQTLTLLLMSGRRTWLSTMIHEWKRVQLIFAAERSSEAVYARHNMAAASLRNRAVNIAEVIADAATVREQILRYLVAWKQCCAASRVACKLGIGITSRTLRIWLGRIFHSWKRQHSSDLHERAETNARSVCADLLAKIRLRCAGAADRLAVQHQTLRGALEAFGAWRALCKRHRTQRLRSAVSERVGTRISREHVRIVLSASFGAWAQERKRSALARSSLLTLTSRSSRVFSRALLQQWHRVCLISVALQEQKMMEEAAEMRRRRHAAHTSSVLDVLATRHLTKHRLLETLAAWQALCHGNRLHSLRSSHGRRRREGLAGKENMVARCHQRSLLLHVLQAWWRLLRRQRLPQQVESVLGSSCAPLLLAMFLQRWSWAVAASRRQRSANDVHRELGKSLLARGIGIAERLELRSMLRRLLIPVMHAWLQAARAYAAHAKVGRYLFAGTGARGLLRVVFFEWVLLLSRLRADKEASASLRALATTMRGRCFELSAKLSHSRQLSLAAARALAAWRRAAALGMQRLRSYLALVAASAGQLRSLAFRAWAARRAEGRLELEGRQLAAEGRERWAAYALCRRDGPVKARMRLHLALASWHRLALLGREKRLLAGAAGSLDAAMENAAHKVNLAAAVARRLGSAALARAAMAGWARRSAGCRALACRGRLREASVETCSAIWAFNEWRMQTRFEQWRLQQQELAACLAQANARLLQASASQLRNERGEHRGALLVRRTSERLAHLRWAVEVGRAFCAWARLALVGRLAGNMQRGEVVVAERTAELARHRRAAIELREAAVLRLASGRTRQIAHVVLGAWRRAAIEGLLQTAVVEASQRRERHLGGHRAGLAQRAARLAAQGLLLRVIAAWRALRCESRNAGVARRLGDGVQQAMEFVASSRALQRASRALLAWRLRAQLRRTISGCTWALVCLCSRSLDPPRARSLAVFASWRAYAASGLALQRRGVGAALLLQGFRGRSLMVAIIHRWHRFVASTSARTVPLLRAASLPPTMLPTPAPRFAETGQAVRPASVLSQRHVVPLSSARVLQDRRRVVLSPSRVLSPNPPPQTLPLAPAPLSPRRVSSPAARRMLSPATRAAPSVAAAVPAAASVPVLGPTVWAKVLSADGGASPRGVAAGGSSSIPAVVTARPLGGSASGTTTSRSPSRTRLSTSRRPFAGDENGVAGRSASRGASATSPGRVRFLDDPVPSSTATGAATITAGRMASPRTSAPPRTISAVPATTAFSGGLPAASPRGTRVFAVGALGCGHGASISSSASPRALRASGSTVSAAAATASTPAAAAEALRSAPGASCGGNHLSGGDAVETASSRPVSAIRRLPLSFLGSRGGGFS